MKTNYIDRTELHSEMKAYKDTGVIYIGYPECIYCRVAVQVLLDTAKGTKLDNIYYLLIKISRL